MNKRILVLLAFLLLALPVRAQWSGSADLSLGLGGMEGGAYDEEDVVLHGITQGVFQLGHKKEKFSWNTTLDGKWEPKTTDNTRISYKKERLGITYKSSTTRPLSVGLKSVLTWTPDKSRNYTANFLYKFSNDRGENYSVNANGKSEEDNNVAFYYEEPFMDEHKLEAGLKTHRSFDSGRSILESKLNLQAVGGWKVNTWTVFKTGEGDGLGTAVKIEDVSGHAWKYRITPNSLDLNADGDIHLQRTLRDDDIRLKLTPGVRLTVKHALDENSGATRIGFNPEDDQGTWRDSTRLREDFNYLSFWTEPYLIADFRWEKLEAHADYAAQVYGRRLNDIAHKQPLKIKGVYPVGKANLKWTISPSHSLNLTNEMSVKHPDYLKVCWYDRTAGYLDKLYRGNEQILSPETHRYGLEYELKVKRFLSKTTFSYTSVLNEIDQTWSNEEIDGRQYKVFRWLNSSDSRAIGFSQDLGWRGKIITANASVSFNQTRRVGKSDGAVKDNFDWRLNSDLTARLNRGWTLSFKAKFQSKVATFFTMFKQYCTLDARVQKEFKRVTLYLEGRDLLDQMRETEFQSAEQQEYWIEQVRDNRRVFILGVNWKF